MNEKNGTFVVSIDSADTLIFGKSCSTCPNVIDTDVSASSCGSCPSRNLNTRCSADSLSDCEFDEYELVSNTQQWLYSSYSASNVDIRFFIWPNTSSHLQKVTLPYVGFVSGITDIPTSYPSLFSSLYGRLGFGPVLSGFLSPDGLAPSLSSASGIYLCLDSDAAVAGSNDGMLLSTVIPALDYLVNNKYDPLILAGSADALGWRLPTQSLYFEPVDNSSIPPMRIPIDPNFDGLRLPARVLAELGSQLCAVVQDNALCQSPLTLFSGSPFQLTTASPSAFPPLTIAVALSSSSSSSSSSSPSSMDASAVSYFVIPASLYLNVLSGREVSSRILLDSGGNSAVGRMMLAGHLWYLPPASDSISLSVMPNVPCQRSVSTHSLGDLDYLKEFLLSFGLVLLLGICILCLILPFLLGCPALSFMLGQVHRRHEGQKGSGEEGGELRATDGSTLLPFIQVSSLHSRKKKRAPSNTNKFTLGNPAGKSSAVFDANDLRVPLIGNLDGGNDVL